MSEVTELPTGVKLRLGLLQTRLILRRCDELLSRGAAPAEQPVTGRGYRALPGFHTLLTQQADLQRARLRSLQTALVNDVYQSRFVSSSSSAVTQWTQHEALVVNACFGAITVLCAAIRAIGGDQSAERIILQLRLQQYCSVTMDRHSSNCSASLNGIIDSLLQYFDMTLCNLDVESARLSELEMTMNSAAQTERVSREESASSMPPITLEEIDSVIPAQKVGTCDLPHYIGEACAICFENYNVFDEARTFIPCKHVFHRSCLDKWLLEDLYRALHGPQCPLCRTILPRIYTEISH